MGWAQKALVLAVAQNRERQAQVNHFTVRISELEKQAARARAAGEKGAARDAAETIAALGVMKDRASQGLSGFEEEFARLRQMLRTAKRALAHLQGGPGATEGGSAVWWRRDHGSPVTAESGLEPCDDAETVLARLYGRQTEIDRANVALRDLDAQADSAAIPRFKLKEGSREPKRK